jgi:hypothetical protein
MIKLKTYAKKILMNRFEHACFLLNPARKSLLRMFESYSSNDDLFNFANAHFGIGQNREEFLRFLTYTEKMNPRVICEIGVRGGGTNFMLANALRSCRVIIGVDMLLQHVHLLRYFCRSGVSRFFVSGDSSALHTEFKRLRSVSGGMFNWISCS